MLELGADMTLVSPRWLNDGGLGSNDGVKKVKRKRVNYGE